MTNLSLEVIQSCEPCDTNFFERAQEHTWQWKVSLCPNYSQCSQNPINCALRDGMEVAKYTAPKITEGFSPENALKSELLNYSNAPHLRNLSWNSDDGKAFYEISNPSQLIKAVERFARIILSMNPDKSIFPECNKCNGIILEREVIDSGRDGVSLLSGSGRTRKRSATYCPSCDPIPRNGTFDETKDPH